MKNRSKNDEEEIILHSQIEAGKQRGANETRLIIRGEE